jgi:glycosyltransferase involved in cell wall biosynthesis
MRAPNSGVIVELQRLRILESGLGQYCLHLGRSLAELASLDLPVQFYVPENRMGIFGQSTHYRAMRFWDRWLGISTPPGVIWHCTHQDSRYWPRERGTRIVLTVHDLNFLQPGSRPAIRERRLRRLQKAVSRVAAIIVISRFTESELRRNVRVNVPVHLIYPGNCLEDIPPRRPEWYAGGQFLLSLGHIHPKKNLHVLLPLLRDHPDLMLVLAGVKNHPYAAHLEREAEQLGVRHRILIPGVVPEDVRLWLYRSCEAFVMPSLAEGFGLPALEAMSQGKPVFLARRTSLPEVGGDSAFYWDDFEPAAMNRVFDEGMRLWFREPGREEKARRWAAGFTWAKSAAQHFVLYRQLTQDGKS